MAPACHSLIRTVPLTKKRLLSGHSRASYTECVLSHLSLGSVRDPHKHNTPLSPSAGDTAQVFIHARPAAYHNSVLFGFTLGRVPLIVTQAGLELEILLIQPP